MLNDPRIALFATRLQESATRQRVISQNLANAETPHYKAFRVAFAGAQAQHGSGATPGGQLPLTRTDPAHLPGVRGGSAGGQITRDHSTTLRNDGNNVDVDRELADLAANQLYYTALATFTQQTFEGYRRVISGRNA